jgi:hypothetical protein
MKVHKMPLQLLIPLMIKLSKRRIIKNNKATGIERENVKRKERGKENESEKGKGNANARETESAAIREAEVEAMTEKEAEAGTMAGERVIEGHLHRLLRKREATEIPPENNVRGKMITPNSNCKNRPQT